MKSIKQLIVLALVCVLTLMMSACSDNSNSTNDSTNSFTANTTNNNDSMGSFDDSIEGHFVFNDEWEGVELDIVGDSVLLTDMDGTGAVGEVDSSSSQLYFQHSDDDDEIMSYEFVNDKLVVTNQGYSPMTFTRTESKEPALYGFDDGTYHSLTDDKDYECSLDIDGDRVLLTDGEISSTGDFDMFSGEIAWDDGNQAKLIIFNDKIAYVEDDQGEAIVFASNNYYGNESED